MGTNAITVGSDRADPTLRDITLVWVKEQHVDIRDGAAVLDDADGEKA